MLRKNHEDNLVSHRNSNLELFRIITMLLIIAHHYVVNSGLRSPIYENIWSAHSIFLLLFGAWGKTGINCFMLITGYFMCKSQISARKFVKILFLVMFYRLSIYAVFWISGYGEFSIKELVKSLLLITDISDGFTNAYIVFFLFIPFINVLIRNITQRQHAYLLLLTLFMYTVLGTFRFVFTVRMNYVSWFFVLYLISSYVRMYPNMMFGRTKLWGFLSILCVLVSALSVVICAVFINDGYYFVQDSNTFLALATAFCAFMYFKNVEIKYSPFINKVAATCFGVLQIHAHSSEMRQWLWQDILRNVEMYHSSGLYLHAIFSALAVFAVCASIEHIRIVTLEKSLLRMWDKRCDHLSARFQKIEAAVLRYLKIS